MSYQIYYDRAYVRVGDNFIPLVNSGSNNCFEIGPSGRDRCEKDWNVQNWKREGQFIFTETEIRDIARDYDQHNQECGVMYKSRNRCFAPGEMERWIINGMKNAYTIEEYVSFGNNFYVLDYSENRIEYWKRHPFSTTAELLKLLDDLKDDKGLEITLEDNRAVYRSKTARAPGKALQADGLTEYYVLKGVCNGREAYFISLNRAGGFRYLPYCLSSAIKVFRSEKEAHKYLDKYHDRFHQYGFKPEKITTAA